MWYSLTICKPTGLDVEIARITFEKTLHDTPSVVAKHFVLPDQIW